ncbi:hypothetical protein D3C86_1940770 [compost metagenome]
MPKQHGLVHTECMQVVIKLLDHIVEPQGRNISTALLAAPRHIQSDHSFETSGLLV